MEIIIIKLALIGVFIFIMLCVPAIIGLMADKYLGKSENILFYKEYLTRFLTWIVVCLMIILSTHIVSYIYKIL